MTKKFKITFFGWLYIILIIGTCALLLINNIMPLPKPPMDFKGDINKFNGTTLRDYMNILVPFGSIITGVGIMFVHVLYGYHLQLKTKKNNHSN